jgi:hypothetical protein
VLSATAAVARAANAVNEVKYTFMVVQGKRYLNRCMMAGGLG